jgi:hypothetical protein
MEERDHGVLDLVLLAAVMCLALGAWAFLNGVVVVPAQAAFISVAVTLVLALASLTRQPRWAAAIRFVTGLWIIATPYVFGFAAVPPALRLHLAVGTLVTTLAMPGFAALCRRRVRLFA